MERQKTTFRPSHPIPAIAVGIFLCVCILYARTVCYGALRDDVVFLDKLRAVSGNVLGDATYYRPLGALSVAIWPSASVQHAVNVLLHAANSVLVFALSRALMPRVAANDVAGLWTAALAALVFAVNPADVQAVAMISGRYDTLMLFWVLLCILAVVRAPFDVSPRNLLTVMLLFFAALCSQEAAVGLLAALPLVLLLEFRLRRGEMKEVSQALVVRRWLLVLLLATIAYVALRAVVAPGFMVNEFGIGVQKNTLKVICVFAVLIVFAAKGCNEAWAELANVALAGLATIAMALTALLFGGTHDGGSNFSYSYALAPLALLTSTLGAVTGTWWAQHRNDPPEEDSPWADELTFGDVLIWGFLLVIPFAVKTYMTVQKLA
ncbi:MAG: hypothetical protein IKZ87_04150 [Actinomycetaceae bacterium]|nr:hypothetical protein [Actinomycetaceae bacterium]